MRIDHDYLRSLLTAFQAAEGPTTDIDELDGHGINRSDDRFLFHLQLMEDESLVVGTSGDGELGYQFYGGGGIVWSVVPIRLTAWGHHFADAMLHDTVWKRIKTDFRTVSIRTLVSTATTLFEKAVVDRIDPT